MSDLLNHTTTHSPDKNVKVNVKSISRKEAGFVNATDQIPTYDVNMRIDNHARNAILALSKASGEKKTASETITHLIEEHLNDMDPYTFSVYEGFLNVLEKKDELDFKSKHR